MCNIHVNLGLLTPSVNITPNFQTWYFMSMVDDLRKITSVDIHTLDVLMSVIFVVGSNLKFFTRQTRSCLAPPVSSHAADSHPAKPDPHPGAQRFFLCRKCRRTYPEPGHGASRYMLHRIHGEPFKKI